MRNLDSLARDHAGADHILSLLRRLRLDWLLHRIPPRLVRSLCEFGSRGLDQAIVLATSEEAPPSVVPQGVKFLSPAGETKCDNGPRSTAA